MPALKEESVPDWITDASSAFHSTYVQLPGRKSICRRLSGHTALDTSGHDLICFVTTELGQDSQLEK